MGGAGRRGAERLVTLDLLLALVVFCVIATATPGPNNAMVLASGATFGFRRTVPHILGIALGVAVMIGAVGLGLGAVFRAAPVLYDVLRIVGIAYLLLLAWRISRSRGLGGDVDGRAEPLGTVGAAAFQWVNPKAWVTVIALLTAYAPKHHYLLNVLVVALVFASVALVSVGVWAAFGIALAQRLTRPQHLRFFNVAMAALLVLSLVPLVAGVE